MVSRQVYVYNNMAVSRDYIPFATVSFVAVNISFIFFPSLSFHHVASYITTSPPLCISSSRPYTCACAMRYILYIILTRTVTLLQERIRLDPTIRIGPRVQWLGQVTFVLREYIIHCYTPPVQGTTVFREELIQIEFL